MADTTELHATKLRLIPPPALRLTRRTALRWLSEDAGDWVLAVGLSEDRDAETREALGVLAVDVSNLVDACAGVLVSGKAATIAQDGDRRERPDVERELARIIAARPHGSEGGFLACFDALAQRLVELLAQREAA